MIYSTIILLTIIITIGFPIIRKQLGHDFLENIFVILSVGLSILTFLLVLFNQIYIPIHYILFLIIGIITTTFSIYKTKINWNFKFNYSTIIVLFLAIIVFTIMIKGAFTYTWLEDDDSWDHATAAKYIAEHNSARKSISQEDAYGRFYMEPYPPAYALLNGLAHQTNNKVNETLKLVNVLLITLSIFFFYLFANEFFKSKYKAIFATFIISVLPSYMNHFIWAQTLAVTLIFPALYFTLKAYNTKTKIYFILSIIAISSILMTQQTTGMFFGIMFILLWFGLIIEKTIKEKKLNPIKTIFYIGLISIIVASIVFWIPIFIKFGIQGTMEGMGFTSDLLTTANEDTSGGIIYSLSDFITAPTQTKIDQATGWGLFIFILVIMGLIITSLNLKKYQNITLLFWFLFTLLGTEGNALPIKLFPHRFWVFLAIPVALIATNAIFDIPKNIPKKIKNIFILIFIIGILFTSLYPKYIVQTAIWPAGGNFKTMDEMQGYLWMKEKLPPNTPVLNICGREEKVIGFNMYAKTLDLDTYKFKQNLNESSTDEILNFLIKNNYKYFIIDTDCINLIGENKSNTLLKTFYTSQTLKHSTNNFFLFKIK